MTSSRGRARGRALAAVVLLTIARPAAGRAQRVVPKELDGIVGAQRDSGFRGVVLVASGDSIVLRRAYGPGLTGDSPFWIGSITKSFTAAAVLSLAHDRRLSLDDSLGHFFAGTPADKRAISIRQLLTHTAGFAPTGAGFGITDRDSAGRAILAESLAYRPGAGYRYGDDDYELLAAIVERVTGKRWSDVVRQRVLAPAGLRHTAFWCDGAPRELGARCSPRGADYGHRGANGMSSTADDLLRWSRWLARAPALAAIETPQVAVRREGDLDVAHGFGARLYVCGGRVVEAFHSGSSDDGHTVVVRRLASGLTIVVLSDAGQHGGTTWASYVASRLVPRQRTPCVVVPELD